MLPIVAKVKRWWRPDSSRGRRLAAYRLRCACGATLTGPRKSTFQLVRCDHCGKDRFVLPLSPLPSVVDSLLESRPSAVGPAPPAGRPVTRWRRLALVGVGAALVAAALAAVAYGPWLGGAGRTLPGGRAAPAGDAAELLRAARAHLAVGNFRLAVAGLRDLAAFPDGRPRREGEALLAQAALLADLSAEPLEKILAHAAGAQPAEWAAEFPARYRGAAVAFDLEMSGPPGGPYQHTWALAPGVHMDFAELELLRRLPLAEPTRLLFGARLERVGRDSPASWEVRFAPGSGVLLTDPSAAAACCPYLGEAELRALVHRQACWLP